MLEHTLSGQTRVLLDGLFVQSPTLDGEPVDSQTAAYKLTLLKKLSQSTKPAKIKERVTEPPRRIRFLGGKTARYSWD
jgi:hypothetical protein